MLKRFNINKLIGGKSNLNDSTAKPKVLVLSKYYHPYNGGIEGAAKILCEGLLNDNDVMVICFDDKSSSINEIVNGVCVNRFRAIFKIKSQPISISYLFAAIFSKCDIIHFHAPNVIASLAIAIRPKKKIIVFHHMDIYGRPKLRKIALALYDAVLRRANLLVVTSLKNAEISNDLRIEVPTRAVPLGIDPVDYVADKTLKEEAQAWREKLSANFPLVGFVGRHARYKGLDVLLDAMKLLPDVHLAIAGDGELQVDLRKQANDLEIADRVHFLGAVSHRDKLKLLSMIDVFAFPSTEITEAFGISQLEAMIMEVPVVASDLPTGVSDVSRNEDTALTVPPRNSDALASALKRVIYDSDLRQKLVISARDRVLEKFTTKAMTGRFNRLNRDVLNPHSEISQI